MHPPSIVDAKRSLRRHLRDTLPALEPPERAAVSWRICGRVIRLELAGRKAWQEAGVVVVYWALDDEPDVEALIDRALLEGKTVCLPRMVDGDAGLEAVAIEGVGFERAEGRFGVVEPAGGRVLGMDEIDAARGLIVAPGVAFDRAGGRLGRGKGYYDRFVSRRGDRTTLCGVCFGSRVVDAVPQGEGDQRMDAVVWEDGAAECCPGPSQADETR